MINWSSKLDNFGRNLIDALGGDPSWLSTEKNIVIEALKQGDFAEQHIVW